MRIVLWIKGERGAACLGALHEHGWDIALVVQQPDDRSTVTRDLVDVLGLPAVAPDNQNDASFAEHLRAQDADLFVLAGYGRILSPLVLSIPKSRCINLHAGKLPQYRGSSPLNWALINGEPSFTLSILQVDAGVDTGGVLMTREFPIGPNDTIVDLHRTANTQFPDMLASLLARLDGDASLAAVRQPDGDAGYYPLRFSDDGLILWDTCTAAEIHNRIRALTEPYPCAFTYGSGRRIRLIASALDDRDHFGEPGRIYRKSKRGLLVCARDKCLWVTRAVFDETSESVFDSLNRYDELSTVRRAVHRFEESQVASCV